MSAEDWETKPVSPASGETAPAAVPGSPAAWRSDAPPPDRRYQVLGEVGRGGLGVVLRARDTWLGREVALKQLHAGPEHVARFRREALLTARLQHPGIVPVYDAATWSSGETFYAMKLFEGRSLAERIEAARTLGERLALLPAVAAVCEAVAYAHGQAIVHRDLKPDNVVLGELGEVIVLDWGLAKVMGEADAPAARAPAPGEGALTEAGAVMGTPAYMAPEQAAGLPADPRSDVFALGAILDHLLAGRSRFAGRSGEVILAELRRGAPIAPLTERAPETPPDLAAIVDKATVYAAAGRYPTARELAEDLRRFLAGRLVSAYAYSLGARVRRWLRRHRAVVAVAAAALLALAALGVYSFDRVLRERNVARAERARAEEREAEATLELSRRLIADDPTAALARVRGLAAPPLGAAVHDVAERAVAEGVARHVHRASAGSTVTALALSQGWLAALSSDGEVYLADHGGGRAFRWRATPAPSWLAFVADGDLVFGGPGPTWRWRAGAAAPVPLEIGSHLSHAVAAGGSLLGVTAGGSLLRWLPGQRVEVLATGRSPGRVAASPDGAIAAVAGEDGGLAVWAASEGLVSVGAGAPPLAVSRARGAVAAAAPGGKVILWEAARGRRELDLHGRRVLALAFSEDGRLLASGGEDRVLRLTELEGLTSRVVAENEWPVELRFSGDTLQVAARQLILIDVLRGGQRRLRGHHGTVWSIAALDEPPLWASGDEGGMVRLWRREGAPPRLVVEGQAMRGLALSRDGALLATTHVDGAVRLGPRDALDRPVVARHSAEAVDVDLSPDGRVGSGGQDGSLLLDGVEVGRLGGRIERVRFSARGARLAAGAWDGGLGLVDVSTGGFRRLPASADRVIAVAFAGEEPVSASFPEGDVRLWSVADGTSRIVHQHAGGAVDVEASPDGAWLASGGFDATVRLSPTAGGPERAFAGHAREVIDVAFSPDGRLLASASADGTVRVWDVASGHARVLAGHTDFVWRVAFAPGGRHLASGSADRTIRVWDLADGHARLLVGHSGAVQRLLFTPDGDDLYSAGREGSVWLWPQPLVPGAPGDPEGLRRWMEAQSSATLQPDGSVASR